MAKIRMDGEIFAAERGERLSDVLLRAGKPLSLPCGGSGICRKCRVTVNGQEVLACRYVIENDTEVQLPKRETIVAEAVEAAGGQTDGPAAAALDLGTTTLALALVLAVVFFVSPAKDVAPSLSMAEKSLCGHDTPVLVLVTGKMETIQELIRVPSRSMAAL